MNGGRGVIDRFEDGIAVVLAGEDEEEFLVPVRDLPQGAVPGDWLAIIVEKGRLRALSVDRELTARRRALVQEQRDRLKRRRQD